MKFPNGLSAINKFYGIPFTADMKESAAWKAENIIEVQLPFPMRLSWNLKQSVTKVEFHKKAADALVRSLTDVYNYARAQVKKKYGYDQTTAFYDQKTLALLQALGLDLFGGSYVFRAKRGLQEVSVHSYGAAIDINPDANPLQSGSDPLRTTMPSWYVKIWNGHGATWGGSWKGRRDPMHMQFASGY